MIIIYVYNQFVYTFFFNSWMIRRFSKYVAKEKNILTLSLDINTLAMSTNNDKKKKKILSLRLRTPPRFPAVSLELFI